MTYQASHAFVKLMKPVLSFFKPMGYAVLSFFRLIWLAILSILRSAWLMIVWFPNQTTATFRLATGYIRKYRQRHIDAKSCISTVELLENTLPKTHAKYSSPTYSCSIPNHPSDTSSSKSECWACTRTICSYCTHTRLLPLPRTTAHLEHCNPFCTRCHFSKLRHPPSSSSSSSPLHAPVAPDCTRTCGARTFTTRHQRPW